MNFSHESLKEYVSEVLQKVEVSEKDSKITADSLVSANLRGVDSHGVTRLQIYIQRLQSGAINPKPDIKIIDESDSVLVLDGDDGLGQVVGAKALELGIPKAKKSGGLYIGVKRSSHFGTGAFFVKKGLEQNFITYAMSNAPATMAPWGGKEPYFGTNPYAYGIPAGVNKPIILDMATSVVARGKVILAEKRGESIPEGWAIDKDGKPTTNSKAALDGSVLPFGGPKGYAISLMIDVMSGVLTGAGFGPHINQIYGDYDKSQNVGHFFQLIDVNKFMPEEEFKDRIDQMINEIKASSKADGVEEIFLPGEIEENIEADRLKNGITLPQDVYEEIKQVGAELGVNIEAYQNLLR